MNPTHWRGWRVGDLVTASPQGSIAPQPTGSRLPPAPLAGPGAVGGRRGRARLLDGDVRPWRVVGLSVDGNEARAGRTGPWSAPAFRLAVREGFGCVADAGESSGPEGVRARPDLLAVDRIDDGLRAVEDPALVTRLAGSASCSTCASRRTSRCSTRRSTTIRSPAAGRRRRRDAQHRRPRVPRDRAHRRVRARRGTVSAGRSRMRRPACALPSTRCSVSRIAPRPCTTDSTSSPPA